MATSDRTKGKAVRDLPEKPLTTQEEKGVKGGRTVISAIGKRKLPKARNINRGPREA